MKSASLIVFALLAVSSASAEDSRERAKDRYLAGEAAFKMGQFERALEEYTAAYHLDAHPDLLFNIAQCHRNMRNFDEAIFFLDRYLQEADRIEDRERVEALIEELEGRRAEQRRLEALRDQRERGAEKVVETRVVTTTVAQTSLVAQPVNVEKPVYQRPWFWGVVAGAAAVVGGAVAIAVVSSRERVPAGDYEYDLR